MTPQPSAAPAAAPDTDVRTAVDFTPEWGGVRGVFGGRVIAAVAEAARAHPETEGLALGSCHVEFTGGAVGGPAHLDTHVVHRGRSSASLEVVCRQVQGNSERRVVGSTTKFLARGASPVLGPHVLPEGPLPDDLDDFDPPWGALPYDPMFGMRLVAHTLEQGAPTTRAWLKVEPGTGLGAHGSVAALLDVLPPGLFMREPLPKFTPTVDFTMHVDAAALPVEGEWVLGTMRTEWADDAYCLETATLHGLDGRFIARGTQNRRVVR